ncbi:unnamed protein product [marine sediment metagenome]|uniref:Positive regulator of sigma(E), RseC/MucC n=1 Tax=marine sediment metagenome TaxID=412755 RepID=X0S750_9ZZZZ
MEAQKSEGITGCDHECDSCALGHHAMPTGRGDLVGIKLVTAGVLTFLFPLMLAIAGVVFAGGGQTRQVAGAVIGLVIGVVLAAVTVRLFMKANRSPNNSDIKNCDIGEIEHFN